MVFEAVCENEWTRLESTSFLPVLLKEVYFLSKSNPFSPYTVVLSHLPGLWSLPTPINPLSMFVTVRKHVLYLPFYKKHFLWIHTFISLLPCITESLSVVSNSSSPIHSSPKFNLASASSLQLLSSKSLTISMLPKLKDNVCPHLTRPFNNILRLTTPSSLKHPLQSFHEITHSWFSSCLIHSFNKWTGNICYVTDTFLGAWNILKNKRNQIPASEELLWKYGRWAINSKNKYIRRLIRKRAG